MKNFALIGAAGYISPRHLKAIKETSNILLAAYDPHDSVGILDSYFPDCDFFTEFERFDRHIDNLKRQGVKIDYLTVCSPNYLHDAHIRFGLRIGADVICEKPLVLTPENAEALHIIQSETRHKINNILQLRLHPALIRLKKHIDLEPDKIFNVELTYITSRGHWYHSSWKGDISRSGGVTTNIAIHFFDLLCWLFGKPMSLEVHYRTPETAAGYLQFKGASVKWFVSTCIDRLPYAVKAAGQRTYRSIRIDGNEIEFSDGFTDLHTESYKAILSGNGFGIEDCLPSLEIAYAARNRQVIWNEAQCHPMVK